jgi:hypothetical protein
MTADQITLQARLFDGTGAIATIATSLSRMEARTWRQLLDPFLQVGRPLGRGYLDFGARVAAIRWYGDARLPLAWEYAHAFVGDRTGLIASQTLELPELNPADLPGGGLMPVEVSVLGPRHDAIAALARSADARPVLISLLAHVLWGERRIAMPWQEPSLPEAALWGLARILEIIRDAQPLSFLTYASGSLGPDALPGAFVSFQPGGRPVLPDSGFLRLATLIVEQFADSPDQLRLEVARHGVDVAEDRHAKIKRLLTLLPTTQPKATGDWWTSRATSTPRTIETPGATRTTTGRGVASKKQDAPADVGPRNASQHVGQVVVCPICLGDITDWDTQSPWQWESALGKYTEREIPAGLNELQRAPYLHGAYIRCTAQQKNTGQHNEDPHFLPANYGRFGRPVVLGFVGLSMAGKTHLLSAMVAGIVGGELRKRYEVSHSPLDQARHQTFLDNSVNPLLRQDKVLPGTGETDIVEFADAFLMNDQAGQPRPVAFFDIAGGDLASLRKRATDFLYMADGLFFVVDPERLDDRWVEDKTFSNVLDIVRERPRPDRVSAAIVLAKADKLRFEEPVARWLRPEPEPLNATQFLRESADIYAYLAARNALALTEPYDKCAKATLHVASATGGNGEENNTVYPRGVRPQQVMRPLAAMLAMTGVLTGPEAEKVGI